MQMNKAGMDLIKKWEGFSDKPYVCAAGKITIGFGFTFYPNGRKVSLDDTPISMEYAEHILKEIVDEKAYFLKKFLDVRNILWNNNEFSAIVSFVFNVGIAPIVNGNTGIHKAIVMNDKDRIANVLLLYNKATINGEKKELRGLTNRRREESELFLCPC
jgi:lysozyme